MPRPAPFGRVDDQLLPGPVDQCSAPEQAGAGDSEPVQNVLDRPGQLMMLSRGGKSDLHGHLSHALGAGGASGSECCSRKVIARRDPPHATPAGPFG